MIDDDAVCRLAQRLNGGKPCTIEHNVQLSGTRNLTGRTNYHASLRFKGSPPAWLLRVPRVTTFAGYPLDLVGYLVKSEYATLKFLGYTSVQAPQVYAYGVAGHGHGVGVSFVLMEELIGKPWIRQTATAEENSKVWKNLANFMAEIEKYLLELAGSLIIHRDNFQLTAVASDRSLVLNPRGPFADSKPITLHL